MDAAGYKTTYSYDSAGNVTSKREYAVAIAGWTGNRQVAATAVANANDRITSTAYDKVGRVVRESLTDGSGKASNELRARHRVRRDRQRDDGQSMGTRGH